jgi:hypothetical protein
MYLAQNPPFSKLKQHELKRLFTGGFSRGPMQEGCWIRLPGLQDKSSETAEKKQCVTTYENRTREEQLHEGEPSQFI